MNIFKKMKVSTADEDALIDKLSQNTDKQARPEASRRGSTEAEIEKLSAQMNALREVLQAQQERFERQGEEIGSLRSTIAERERQMHDLEAKALKASELVEDVQPEKLASEQKKTDAKIEAMRAKIDSGELLSNNIIEELKKIKNSLSVFRGTEEVVKLNKEVMDELKSIKKVEAMVEKHADRVEAIFSSFESNFQLFEKMKEDLKNLSDAHSAVAKEVEKNSATLKDTPKKDEFYQVKTSVEKAIEDVKNDKESYEKRNMSFLSTIESLAQKIKVTENNLNSFSKTVEELSKVSGSETLKADEILKKLDKLGKSYSEISILKEEAYENSRRISAIMDALEKMSVLIEKRAA